MDRIAELKIIEQALLAEGKLIAKRGFADGAIREALEASARSVGLEIRPCSA
jgi:hypothetical protein